MSNNNEYETSPIAPQNLQPARHLAVSYTGEHVAGTKYPFILLMKIVYAILKKMLQHLRFA
ncbi:MAG: hypothetical protein P8Y45_18050 [Exilibacterium sp.]